MVVVVMVSDSCDAASERDTLEHLVEHDDDEERDEVAVSSNYYGDTDHCSEIVSKLEQ